MIRDFQPQYCVGLSHGQDDSGATGDTFIILKGETGGNRGPTRCWWVLGGGPSLEFYQRSVLSLSPVWSSRDPPVARARLVEDPNDPKIPQIES